jgi:hypothetical protein
MNILIKPAFACAVICFLGTVFGTTSANAAPKQGLQKGYLGAGLGFGEGDSAFHLHGRISFGDTPVSIRPTAYFFDGGTFSTTTVTYDIGVAEKTNVYVGLGGFVDNSGIFYRGAIVDAGGLLQVGAEKEISKNLVLYGDGNFLDRASIFKVGVGYSF